MRYVNRANAMHTPTYNSACNGAYSKNAPGCSAQVMCVGAVAFFAYTVMAPRHNWPSVNTAMATEDAKNTPQSTSKARAPRGERG